MRSPRYRVFLAVCAGLIVLLLAVRQRPLDWTLTLRPDRNTPYSAELLARHLPDYLPGRVVVERRAAPSDLLDTLRTPATFLLVTPSVEWESATVGRVLAFARRGGRVLVVAETFDGLALDDSLGLRTTPLLGGPPLAHAPGDTVRVTLGAASARVDRALVQARLDRPLHDSSRTRTLPPAYVVAHAVGPDSLGFPFGGDADGDRDAAPDAPAEADTFVVGARVPVGQGHVVVLAAPWLLTNYGLRYGHGDDLLRGLLAYAAPDGPVVWTAAAPAPGGSVVPLAYVFQHPAFLPAWRTALAAVLLAMAFRLRRRQRVIPVVEPPRNATVGFARVVSRLYFLRGDHAHLARTLRRQFYAYARDTLLVAAAPDEPSFVPDVASRAAATEAQVHALVARLGTLSETSDGDALLALARDLDAFYAASPRGRP